MFIAWSAPVARDHYAAARAVTSLNGTCGAGMRVHRVASEEERWRRG